MPLDGVNGFERNLMNGSLSVAVNSPINFAGVSGSVDPNPAVPAGGPSTWVLVAGALLILGYSLAAGLGSNRRQPSV
jgi:hypothetical protein